MSISKKRHYQSINDNAESYIPFQPSTSSISKPNDKYFFTFNIPQTYNLFTEKQPESKKTNETLSPQQKRMKFPSLFTKIPTTPILVDLSSKIF